MEHRSTRDCWLHFGHRKWNSVDLFARHVLGQLEVHRSRFAILGDSKRLSYEMWEIVGVDHLLRELGDRLHHANDVENLKTALLALFDWLLTGDADDRHAPE